MTDTLPPGMLAALESIITPEVFHVAVNGLDLSNDEMRRVIEGVYETARLALAKGVLSTVPVTV